jgi:drug/metabolite transporter (DMT)-like permease
MISFTIVATWIAIVGSWGCLNVVCAFAIPKTGTSLLVNQHFRDPRQWHPRSPTIPLTQTSEAELKKKAFTSSLSATEVQEAPDNSASINRGRLLLVLVAVLYGSLNVALRFVYDVPKVPPTAAALSATRGWLAFLCFLPPLFLDRKQSANGESSRTTAVIPLFRSGLELAVWGFLAQGLLNVGLVSTGSARASFLTQTSVLFTPLISTLIGKQKVGKNVWLACVVALIGLVVLTVGGTSAAAAAVATSAFSFSLSSGDLFVLGGALSWSMYLFRISALGPKHPDLILQGVKTGLMAILYSVWWIGTTAVNKLPFFSIPSWMASGSIVWMALFFSAIGPGTIADVLQQKGQADISPSETNILLSAEPVFATIFAVLLLGETSSLLEMIGGALILAAAVVASA